MESRELVHFVTQQTRFALINNILQHPEQLPSMYELEELNPSVSEATVYKHIQKLIDAGIVKEVALDDDQRRQGYPWKFYGLTEEGRTFLDEHNLLAEETLQQIYETISDKPEKMVKYENAPARTTRNPYRISFVSVLNHRSISYSPASFWNSDHAKPVVLDLALRLEVLEQRVDHVFESILHRLLSEVFLVDVDVAGAGGDSTSGDGCRRRSTAV